MGIFVLRIKKEAAGVAIAGAPPHFTYYKARLDAITVEVEHQADMFEKIILGKRENIINSPETTHNLSMQIYIYIFLFYITRQVRLHTVIRFQIILHCLAFLSSCNQ